MIKVLRFAIVSLVLFSACKLQQPYVPQTLFLREANVESLDNTQVPELMISRIETESNKVRLFAHLLNAQGDFINLNPTSSRQNWCAVVDQFAGRDNAITQFQVIETRTSIIEEPTAYAIVLDHSGSMAYRVKDMQDAVENFIRNKRPQDAISIVKYDKNARTEVPVQTDLGVILSAYQKNGLNGYGGVTAIINGIHEGIESIRNAPQRQKIVISFTDGGDNSSTITKDYLIWMAQSLKIPICTIDLGNNVNNNFMKEIASATGGTYNYMMYANEFPNVFTDIKNRLTKSYIIEYESPGPGYHQVNLTFCHPAGPLTASANYNNLPLSSFAPIKDAPPISRPPTTDGKPLRPATSNPARPNLTRPVNQTSLASKGNTNTNQAAGNNLGQKPDRPKPKPTKPAINSNNSPSKPSKPTQPNTPVIDEDNKNPNQATGNNLGQKPGRPKPTKPAINSNNSPSKPSRPSKPTQPNTSVTVGGNTSDAVIGNKGNGAFKPNQLPTLDKYTRVKINTSYILPVSFKIGTSDMNTNQSDAAINALVAHLNTQPNLKAALEIYTDNLTQPSNAIALTQQRGQVIKLILIQKGIQAQRITISGKGSADPIADNATTEGKKQNNRVVVRFN